MSPVMFPSFRARTCPTPIVGRGDKFDPEHQALLAESVGLLVVLETPGRTNRYQCPVESLAFALLISGTAARLLTFQCVTPRRRTTR